LLLYVFASGVVLLFAGVQTWRRAWFALALLLFVNPVPHGFDVLVDLPLQYFAAHSARAYAALMGVPVSAGTLKMMFTPRLGMFIAPGCDGLRGAVAMGYLALVIGYLYRLPWRRWGVYVLAAVLLAYLFNLLRLCGVVIYYWFAMRMPAIAHHATLADYLIGGVLFFCAALFLFSVPRRWRACT
ncbi:MAG: exosortase J, partial [Gammaproteobacteria bacterium]